MTDRVVYDPRIARNVREMERIRTLIDYQRYTWMHAMEIAYEDMKSRRHAC